MARPQTILTQMLNAPRYVELPLVTQFGTSERIRGKEGSAHGVMEATISITASFGGKDVKDVIELYTFAADVEAVPSTLPDNKRDKERKRLEAEAIKTLRPAANRLLVSLNNYFHSPDAAPRLMTLEWFIENGLVDKYAEPENDYTNRMETIH